MKDRVLTNALMRKLLRCEEIRGRLGHTSLHPRLQALIESGLTEMGGCWFLRALVRKSFDIKLALTQSFDCTDLEWSLNSIHPEMLVPQDWDPDDLLIQGYEYAMQLAKLLESKGKFRVVLSFDSTDDLLNCTVGFYKLRPNETTIHDDPKSYKEQAVLMLDTPESRQAETKGG